jgi:hypothetical protein
MYGLSHEFDLSFFVGKRLDSVIFYEFSMHFNFDGGVFVTLESAYEHQQKRDVERRHTGTQQSVPVTHSAVMQLVGRTVASAAAEDGGTLAVEFDDGQVLRFLEHDMPYESYEFTDGNELFVV